MKVMGSGTVKAVPDTALVSLGIVTENAVLENARRENAARTAAVINTLSGMGVEKKHIKTGTFAIEPIYDYIDGKQTFRGYRVTNLLNITIEDIARAGEAIDKATFAGANRIDSVGFALSDIAGYYDNALALALENALHKGSEIGRVLGVKVNEIPYKVVEKSDRASVFSASAAKLSAPSTPVMPGQLEVSAEVMVFLGYK